MSGALRPVGSADDLFRLDPIQRFQALITGPNFPGWLRAEPVSFDRDDPIFGYGCSIEDCGQHRTQAGLWCTGHASERLSARHRGIGEAAWKAAAVPFPARPADPDGKALARVLGAVEASTAAATKRAYRSDWDRFAGWAGRRRFPPLPAPPP